MSVQPGWVAAPPGEKFDKKCPMCWNGLCRKHPRQDHGASMKFIDTDKKKDILGKVFDDRIGAALKQRLAQQKSEEDGEEEMMRVGSPPLPALAV